MINENELKIGKHAGDNNHNSMSFGINSTIFEIVKLVGLGLVESPQLEHSTGLLFF